MADGVDTSQSGRVTFYLYAAPVSAESSTPIISWSSVTGSSYWASSAVSVTVGRAAYTYLVEARFPNGVCAAVAFSSLAVTYTP